MPHQRLQSCFYFLGQPSIRQTIALDICQNYTILSFVSLQEGLEMTALHQKANKELLESKEWPYTKKLLTFPDRCQKSWHPISSTPLLSLVRISILSCNSIAMLLGLTRTFPSLLYHKVTPPQNCFQGAVQPFPTLTDLCYIIYNPLNQFMVFPKQFFELNC